VDRYPVLNDRFGRPHPFAVFMRLRDIHIAKGAP
jgi:hypothetical protein